MTIDRLVDDIAQKCTIRPGCLDISLAPTVSDCARRSHQSIIDFLAAHPHLAGYELLKSRRIPQRAVLFATEILGDDHHLTEAQMTRKTALHLLMSVQMTLEWLVDDTLDSRPGLDGETVSGIIELYLDTLESGRCSTLDAARVEAACSKNGIPATFVEALRLLAEWQRRLALAVGIAVDRSSIYWRLNAEFLRSSLDSHKVFKRWERFSRYRTVNCGLALEIFCSAYWLCHLWGADAAELEASAEKYVDLIYRYSILGGVSNDLFGYEKDLEEGVATSVEVIKQDRLAGSGTAGDRRTVEAFRWVIDFHNDRLDELSNACRTRAPLVEKAVLVSSLRASWAIRVLHHEYRHFYRPGWLERVLHQLPRAQGGRRDSRGGCVRAGLCFTP